MTNRSVSCLGRVAERRVVAVIRAGVLTDPLALIDALAAGGVTAVEFTFTSSNTAEAVKLARGARPEVIVGAGTIRTRAQLEAAVAAGARFGVSPHLDPVLVAAAAECDFPYIPGVLTPTEVAQALHLGSEMLKVYPMRTVGVAHLSDIASVFPEVRLMVTGGIRLDEIQLYLDAGAEVVGLGSALTAGAEGSGDLGEVTERARRVTAALATAADA